MNTVDIRYRYAGPVFRKLSVCIPGSWEEITGKQFLLLTKMDRDKDQDIKFLASFTSIPVRIWAMMDEYFIWKITHLLDWMSTPPRISQFYVKEIICGNRRLVSPQNKLKGMTFAQFIFADTAYSEFMINETDEPLNRLVASLYLPEDEAYSDRNSAKRISEITKLDWDTRHAIAMNYGMVRAWISESYPMVFVSDGNKKDAEPKSSSQAWIKTFEMLVGDDIVNQDRYAELPVHNVMRFLTKKAKEYYKR